MRESKVGVEFDRVGSDAGFLAQFAQRACDLGLPRVDMSFRQIPPRRMSHEQEFANGITPGDEHAAGLQFRHGSGGVSN
jgi:hypothetical protein